MQFEEALEFFFDSKMESVHTAFPAIVQSYDGHSKRTCTVVPATNLMLSDGTIVESVPITGVPVVFPSSSAGGILFPIKKGDTVLVVVCEASIGNWLAGRGSVVDPEDSTRFTLHDAIAIPGLWPLGNVPATSMAAKSAGLEFNGARLEITSAGKFKINNDLATAKELIDDVWTELNGVIDDILNGTNPVAPGNGLTLISTLSTPIAGTLFAPVVTALNSRLLEISTKMEKVANLLE